MGVGVRVCVLFTDLVDSTAVSSRLGPDGAEDLRQAHFAVLRPSITAHGGREVKTMGDGLMVVFAEEEATLDGAVAMQQAVERHNRRRPDRPLQVRIGAAAGDCIEEHGDYFGEPVVRAARLCARADAGQILVPDDMGAPTPAGRYRRVPVGPLQLKGLPNPVETVDVGWEPLDDDDADAGAGDADPTGERTRPARSVPLQGRLSVNPRLGFVGRSDESDHLRGALTEAHLGNRRVVVLSGEAGLGKTSVASRFATAAHDGGDIVLYGRCDEELPNPYRPWIEALGHYISHAGIGDIAALGPRVLGDLERMIPAVRDHLPIGSQIAQGRDDRDQYALYAAVTSVLVHLAEVTPIVVVLDDLHWADRGTLRLLQHVVAQVPAARLMILAIYRDTDVAADHPLTSLLADLRRDDGVDRVALSGLSPVDIRAMIEAVAGHELDADAIRLTEAVRDETGGNPFFIGELLRDLAESGRIARGDDGRWALTDALTELGLPQSVREVVRARVKRLGDATHRLLAAAAVGGREFDAEVTAEVIGLDIDEALERLEVASAGGLIAEVAGVADRFTFTHALVQHTLYDDLPASRRIRLHHRLAEVIEGAGVVAGDRIAQLAAHWFVAARPVEVEKAITYGLLAGDQALAARAPEDAARWYRQTLELISPSDSRRRCDAVIRLGDALRRAGDAESRELLLDGAAQAQRLGANDLLVRAALANNRGWHSRTGVADAERIAVLESALEAEPLDDASRASLMALLAIEYTSAGDALLERRLALADEAVTVARRLGDPLTLARVLDAEVFSAWIPERLEGRIASGDEALRLAESVGDPVLEYWTASRRGVLAIEACDRATYERTRARQVELVAQLAEPVMRWHTTCGEFSRASLDGDYERAEACANEALQLGMACGQPDAMSYYGAELVTIRGLQGRLGELEPLIRQQAEANPGIASFRVALANVCAESGRHDEAIELLADDVDEGFAAFDHDPMWFINVTGAARVAALIAQHGDRDSAAGLAAATFDLLEPWPDRTIYIDVLARPPIAYYLGMLAVALGRDDTERYFSQAVAVSDAIAAPVFAAMARVEWGACLLADDDGSAAGRTLVGDGLAVAEAAGAGGVAQRARELLGKVD